MDFTFFPNQLAIPPKGILENIDIKENIDKEILSVLILILDILENIDIDIN